VATGVHRSSAVAMCHTVVDRHTVVAMAVDMAAMAVAMAAMAVDMAAMAADMAAMAADMVAMAATAVDRMVVIHPDTAAIEAAVMARVMAPVTAPVTVVRTAQVTALDTARVTVVRTAQVTALDTARVTAPVTVVRTAQAMAPAMAVRTVVTARRTAATVAIVVTPPHCQQLCNSQHLCNSHKCIRSSLNRHPPSSSSNRKYNLCSKQHTLSSRWQPPLQPPLQPTAMQHRPLRSRQQPHRSVVNRTTADIEAYHNTSQFHDNYMIEQMIVSVVIDYGFYRLLLILMISLLIYSYQNIPFLQKIY